MIKKINSIVSYNNSSTNVTNDTVTAKNIAISIVTSTIDSIISNYYYDNRRSVITNKAYEMFFLGKINRKKIKKVLQLLKTNDGEILNLANKILDKYDK